MTHESKMFEALKNIVWYDGHYEWLKELHSKLLWDPKRSFLKPVEIQWHSEEHTIWMLLVGMFGNWGTSIRSGWIDQPKACAEFIEELCADAWGKDNDST